MLLRLRSVSEPFDCSQTVELKFSVEANQRSGELYLRVAASDSTQYRVGDLYAARLVRLE